MESRENIVSRRELFQRAGAGVGSAALSTLFLQDGFANELLDGRPGPQIRPRAKNVIFIHMVGAPSHLDLFENKPILKKYDGKLCPEKYLKGQRFAFLRGHPKLMASRFNFRQRPSNDVELSELLPHLSGVSDEICMIKTLHTEQFNHAPAQLFFQTGFSRFGRPSAGSWISYGLGSENQNLPAFVVMNTGSIAGAGNSLWGSGFLPTVHQGIEFRGKGDPVLFLSNPKGVTANDRKNSIDVLNSLNQRHLDDVGDPEIATRISQYELAFRMQSAVPELADTSDETESSIALYGDAVKNPGFARNCLLARRMVERGVRFVQLFDQGWDHHANVYKSLKNKTKQVDQPIAGLIKDLKQRGLLDDTLVVWGAEFGRTPMIQGKSGDAAGRDHHKDAYCVWMAGGGVKGGYSHGVTDELGYFPVEDSVEVHDFHATLLHILGLNHKKLTFKYQGRPFRLTDVRGKVISEILS